MTDDPQGPQTGLALTDDNAHEDHLEMLRRQGSMAVAEQQTLDAIAKEIRGSEWGSGNSVIRGEAMSDNAVQAFAHFCQITRANPQLHVDWLGGGPYLNAKYYKDLAASDPHHIEDEFYPIDASVPDDLRRRAAELRASAEGLEPGDRRSRLLDRSVDLELQAEDIADLRMKFKVPAWATHAYAVRIRRWAEGAPLEAIRRGQVDDPDRWWRDVWEANWAGGRPEKTFRKGQSGEYTKQTDPIGEDEPEKTSRTRAYRRCAEQAYSAWMVKMDERIQRAERVLDAEFEIVQEARATTRAALPRPDGPQAVRTGGGEPDARRPVAGDTMDLPVDDGGGTTTDPTPAEVDPDGDDAGGDEAADAARLDDARKRYFATYREAAGGDQVDDAKRRQWQVDQGLPASTKAWDLSHYDAATQALVQPYRDEYVRVCQAAGLSPADHAAGLNIQPRRISHFVMLTEEARKHVEARQAEEAAAAGADGAGDDDDAGDAPTAADADDDGDGVGLDREAAKATLTRCLEIEGLGNPSSWGTWTSRHGLPRGLQDWTPEHYDVATTKLLPALRNTLRITALQLGEDVDHVVAQARAGDTECKTLADYVQVFDHLEAQAPDDGGDA